jgi:hypothetical protein
VQPLEKDFRPWPESRRHFERIASFLVWHSIFAVKRRGRLLSSRNRDDKFPSPPPPPPPRRPTNMPPRPTLDGSQHLSLTESHLSTEATTWEQPRADDPPSLTRSADLAARVSASSQSQSHSGETLIEERGDLDVVERVDGDLEKGEKAVEQQKGARGGATIDDPPLAADGTPIIVVDWRDNDPGFPKNC